MSSLTWLDRARKRMFKGAGIPIRKIVRRFRWVAILVAVAGAGLFALGQPLIGMTALGCAALFFAIEARFFSKEILKNLKESRDLLREIRDRLMDSLGR